MLSCTEQKVLEEIYRGSRTALLDIHSMIGKVYDEELAYDLNRQAARYSRLGEKAADSLLAEGVIVQPVGILDRAKRWAAIQAGTALNVSTEHVAQMIKKEEIRRLESIEDILSRNRVTGSVSCELAEEFMAFERENINILGSYHI